MMAGPLDIVVCVQPTTGDGSNAALGPADQAAVEYAVRQVKLSGGNVLAVSLGGSAAITALQESLARGVNDVLHVVADAAPDDGMVTAALLATAVRTHPADLVLCGSHGEQGGHGVVGREIAHLLGLAYVGAVIEIALGERSDPRSATVVQRLERGDRWSWGMDLPAVCGVEPGLCSPRYLAVRRARRAASHSPAIRHAAEEMEAAVEAASAKGSFAIVERVPPRVRPKKPTVTTKALSAADRMKLMRGGGKASDAGGSAGTGAHGSAAEGPQRIKTDGQAAATKILELLESKGL